LPRGWDAQFEQTFRDHDAGLAPTTLGALLIAVDREHRGSRLGGAMVAALRACARLLGFGALIACVRPTSKERHPLVPIAEYATWTREDGLPFDPWIRIHVRLGGRLSRPEPRSMRVAGTVAEWEAWTGMAFPASGRYVIPGGGALVEIDHGADRGIHYDPNVWVVHDLAARSDGNA
jgi:hypothetical protein